jgi:hypothetical protein
MFPGIVLEVAYPVVPGKPISCIVASRPAASGSREWACGGKGTIAVALSVKGQEVDHTFRAECEVGHTTWRSHHPARDAVRLALYTLAAVDRRLI